MSVRIVCWGGIGDALLLTPALRSLKRQHPRARVSVFCPQEAQFEVLQGNPHVDVLKRTSWRSAPLMRAYYLWRPNRFCVTDWPKLAPHALSTRHASEIVGEMLGIEVEDRMIEVFLTPHELASAKARLAAYVNPVVSRQPAPRAGTRPPRTADVSAGDRSSAVRKP